MLVLHAPRIPFHPFHMSEFKFIPSSSLVPVYIWSLHLFLTSWWSMHKCYGGCCFFYAASFVFVFSSSFFFFFFLLFFFSFFWKLPRQLGKEIYTFIKVLRSLKLRMFNFEGVKSNHVSRFKNLMDLSGLSILQSTA